MNKTDGLPMTSSIGAPIADLFMKHFQKDRLHTIPYKHKCLLIYAEDTLTYEKMKVKRSSYFLKSLNNFDKKIRLSLKVEEYCSLPFLKTLV